MTWGYEEDDFLKIFDRRAGLEGHKKRTYRGHVDPKSPKEVLGERRRVQTRVTVRESLRNYER